MRTVGKIKSASREKHRGNRLHSLMKKKKDNYISLTLRACSFIQGREEKKKTEGLSGENMEPQEEGNWGKGEGFPMWYQTILILVVPCVFTNNGTQSREETGIA